MKRQTVALLLCAAIGSHAHAGEPSGCLPEPPVPLTVRIGASAALQALLIGGASPTLQVIDAGSGALLWSAGSTPKSLQTFTAMTAPFGGSLIALDTDQDGLDDRLYAGDLDGRLWRFDLHNGASAKAWASGGVFADFSNGAGRGFLAPPDVVLTKAPAAEPWFSIALGTAAPGHPDANNRFYVLRDATPFAAWTDAQYRNWRPLHESDLLQVTDLKDHSTDPTRAGWFIELGSGDVLSASLTVGGTTVFAVASSSASCSSAFSVGTLNLAERRPVADQSGEWRKALAGNMPIDTAIALSVDETDTKASTAHCVFGDTQIAGCDVDLRPHRTWWLREDAE